MGKNIISLLESLNCMVDLHLHLDGAISNRSARELARIQEINIPDSEEELTRMMRVSPDCRDLLEFLEKFEFPCSLLQTEAGLAKATENLLLELESQGVMYAEIKMAPQKSMDRGLTQEQVVKAVLYGIDHAPIPAQLILCCMRDRDNQDMNMETVKVAEKYLGKGVCALDLAGAESLFPNELFKDIFSYAKEKNIPFVLHAGEASGPQSVESALDMGPVRIGHGVRTYESDEAMRKLAASGVAVEMCPTSNLNTAIFQKLSEYPIRKFMDMGIPVTINTDDPAIEGTDIKNEYRLILEQFDFSQEELKKMLLNSVEYSFASEKLKGMMRDKIESEVIS